jgi:hypothetical protein
VALGHEEAVALAAGMTGVLAVPLAVATFFAERAVGTVRRQTKLRAALLSGLLVSGLYLLLCAAVAWWAWDRAIASTTRLIWGISSGVVFAGLFMPPVLFALVCAGGASMGLFGLVRAKAHERPV